MFVRYKSLRYMCRYATSVGMLQVAGLHVSVRYLCCALHVSVRYKSLRYMGPCATCVSPLHVSERYMSRCATCVGALYVSVRYMHRYVRVTRPHL